MNKAEKFLGKSLVITFVLFLILIVTYSFSFVSEIFFKSAVVGWAISTFNFLLGFFAIKIGLKSSRDVFFKAILGGMVLRLFLVLLLVFISLKFLNINENSFIFFILFFYILYLSIEIIYLYMKKI
jgi:hypothetical protein